MMNLSSFQYITIGQHTQALNNSLGDRYGKIAARIKGEIRARINPIQRVKSFFLASNGIQSKGIVSVDIKMDTTISFQLIISFLVETLMETISKVCSWFAPKRYFSKWFAVRFAPKTYLNRISGHVRNEFCLSIKKAQTKNRNLYLPMVNHNFAPITRACARRKDNYSLSERYIASPKAIKIAVVKKRVRISYTLFDLLSFSRQASLTQAEKLPLPEMELICSSKSSSKRICFIVLLERSKDFFSFLSCIGSYLYDRLHFKGSYHYISNYLKKAMPRSGGTLSRHLTKPLNEVMIMANRYDSAHLRAEQSKLFKFYDLSTAQVIETIAIPHHKKDLHKINHSGYINSALAKSKVRIGTLNNQMAAHDAQCVFFCANACAYLINRFSFMVALAGQPSGWLGCLWSSSSNPVNVTAQEIGTSSGDYNNQPKEDANMATTPNIVLSNQKLFKFYDLKSAQVIETIAPTELQARKNLGKQSLIFIARKPLNPVYESARQNVIGGYCYA